MTKADLRMQLESDVCQLLEKRRARLAARKFVIFRNFWQNRLMRKFAKMAKYLND